ncbi:MAG: cytochrome P450 [Parvibaculales bacterium]
MSEAIKHETRPGEDYAYNTPLKELDPSNLDLWPNEAYWPVFERLRDEDPIHYVENAWESEFRPEDTEPIGPYWAITRYDDIMAVDTDHKRFSSEPAIVLPNPAEDFTLPMFIAMDQPKHDVQRKTVAPIVSPMSLADMSTLIRERTQNLLDTLPVNEEFDWVDTVSIELTTMMLATLFDFPFEDRRKLTRWSDVATAGPESGIVESDDQRRAELMECVEYFMGLWQQRQGKQGFDLITMLANGEETKNMDTMEYLGNLVLLIVGGNDTTRNSMSGSIWGSNLFPSEWEKVRANRDLIPNAVAEIIRWQTPLSYMRRTALEDVEMHGKTIKKGDKIAMWYASGNRDPRKFDNPDVIDFERANARNHIAFGFGIHRCFGNRLAELQLQILWDEMLKRFSKIEVVKEPTRSISNFVKGYTHMSVICRD